jgi:hypothetical protein
LVAQYRKALFDERAVPVMPSHVFGKLGANFLRALDPVTYRHGLAILFLALIP